MKAFITIITLAALIGLQGCRATSTLSADAETTLHGEPVGRATVQITLY
jgi:hypothetical protein